MSKQLNSQKRKSKTFKLPVERKRLMSDCLSLFTIRFAIMLSSLLTATLKSITRKRKSLSMVRRLTICRRSLLTMYVFCFSCVILYSLVVELGKSQSFEQGGCHCCQGRLSQVSQGAFDWKGLDYSDTIGRSHFRVSTATSLLLQERRCDDRRRDGWLCQVL